MIRGGAEIVTVRRTIFPRSPGWLYTGAMLPSRFPAVLLVLLLAAAPTALPARTVFRCLRSGTVSLATAPEPGSRCKAVQIDDNAAKLPNLWGSIGLHHGTLYERQQGGKTVYSTRDLPGSVKVLAFTVETPKNAQAHVGLGSMGPPRLDVYAAQFRAAAKATGVDDAWLRTIAHVESGFDRLAVSPKGAQGLMQLMPDTAKRFGVDDPYSPEQSINAGARQLKQLKMLYRGDLVLVAAAYNAGVATVERYGGVPPYAETEDYVAKVVELQSRYRAALTPSIKTGKRVRKKSRSH
jgi:hypothetical protein